MKPISEFSNKNKLCFLEKTNKILTHQQLDTAFYRMVTSYKFWNNPPGVWHRISQQSEGTMDGFWWCFAFILCIALKHASTSTATGESNIYLYICRNVWLYIIWPCHPKRRLCIKCNTEISKHSNTHYLIEQPPCHTYKANILDTTRIIKQSFSIQNIETTCLAKLWIWLFDITWYHSVGDWSVFTKWGALAALCCVITLCRQHQNILNRTQGVVTICHQVRCMHRRNPSVCHATGVHLVVV